MLKLLLSLTLISCGTLKRKDNIVAIVSEKEGLQVYDEKEKKIGETPFLHLVEPKRKVFFKYRNSAGQWIHKNHRCRPNWVKSIVPNLTLAPMFPVGTVLSGGFLALDSTTGSLFNCQGVVTIGSPTMAQKGLLESGKKWRLLALPVRVPDEKVSDQMIEEVKKAMAKTHPEIELIPYKKYKKDLYFIGYTHRGITQRDMRDFQKLWPFAYQNQANGILYLEVEKRGEKYALIPKIYDAINSQEMPSTLPAITSSYQDKDDDLFQFFIRSIQVLPNSLDYSFNSQTELSYTRADTGEILKNKPATRHPNSLPKVIAAIGFGNTDHPQFFDVWDIDFKLSPSFNLNTWRLETISSGRPYALDMIVASLTADAGVVFHTIFGAFGIKGGLGTQYYNGEDNLGTSVSRFAGISRVNLFYYAFFTDRWYVEFSAKHFEILGNRIKTPAVGLNGWQGFFFGVGYYYPEVKSYLRELF